LDGAGQGDRVIVRNVWTETEEKSQRRTEFHGFAFLGYRQPKDSGAMGDDYAAEGNFSIWSFRS